MYKPILYNTEKSRKLVSYFSGYENNLIIDENAMHYEENMSSDHYPVMAPRKKRGYFNVTGKMLCDLHSKTKICYINNGTLYYDGGPVTDLYFPSDVKNRSFVSMGTKLVVFPDKVYINTADFNDYGQLDAFFWSEKAECTLCRGDGDLYENYTVNKKPPEVPEHGDLWVDTSSVPHTLKQYSSDTKTWVEIINNFVRISSSGIGSKFNKYDSVFLKGFEKIGLNGSSIIYDKSEDYIVVPGMIDQNVTIEGEVSVKRKIPDMDFVCESGNRIWGCSSKTNEIFASKLGDPTNFYSYMGVSTDSYGASVGSDGPFTGVIGYRGYVLFFKENCVHKIYGQNPPYTITTSYIRGVQNGSSKSLCCLNDTLYYKSPTGVCTYNGGIPVEISSALGRIHYRDAVAGVLKNKYYICMTNPRNERELFVYDEDKSLWHREGIFDVFEFAENNLNLYFIANERNTHRLGIIDGENKYGEFNGQLTSYRIEENVEWCVESGLWGLELPENKYYSSVIIKAIGEKGATLKVLFQFNSDGKWIEQMSVKVSHTGSLVLPFITPRCDHLRMKITGTGNVKIINISRKTEAGSDLNV